MNENMNNKRHQYKYEDYEEKQHRLGKEIVLKEIEYLEHINKINIFENQKASAFEILAKLKNRNILNVMVLGKTQSGKTGTMCALLKYYLQDTDDIIPIENIFIITGLSSKEWKHQTKSRMSDKIQDRVYHRNDLANTFSNEIKNKKNVLILIDEVHIASSANMTICNTFKRIGLLNTRYLCDNDVKFVEFSATPDGTLYDLLKWEYSASMIFSHSGQYYMSSYDLLLKNRIKQFKDLSETSDKVYDYLHDLRTTIDTYNDPKYHIIRTKTASDQDQTINNFTKCFDKHNYNYIYYDGFSDIDDINHILNKQPNKHTFIFIKELLRCAKTINKTHAGVLYDRYVNSCDDTTIIQGLVGRATGYDDNGISIIYTNINSIEKYEKLWNSGFTQDIKWRSKSIKNKCEHGNNTINDPKLYDNCSTVDNKGDTDNYEIVLKVFGTQHEMKEYFNKYVKNTISDYSLGPRLRACNINGFYEHKIEGVKKAWTCQEIDTGVVARGVHYNYKNRFRAVPCYKDITDKASVEWRLYYCKKAV